MYIMSKLDSKINVSKNIYIVKQCILKKLKHLREREREREDYDPMRLLRLQCWRTQRYVSHCHSS